MEIWTIKIACVSGWYLEEESAKICEIANTYDLERLYRFILDSFNFDYDHLHEFIISRQPSRSKKYILENESIILKDIFPVTKNHYLFLHYDFGDDWVFKITRHNKKAVPQTKDVSYPRVVKCIGKNPEQYPMIDEE